MSAVPSSPGAVVEPVRRPSSIAVDLTFFFGGFAFDVALLRRIDSIPLLIHQGLYLLFAAMLLLWDHRLHFEGRVPPGLLGRLAPFRLWGLHFLLGTLLNAFMVFYFRASSGLWAFIFLAVLAATIVINEAPRFRARGPIVPVLLLSFSVTSYFAYLLPVAWGELSKWQYGAAVAMGSGATLGLWRLSARIIHDPLWTFRRAVAPGLLLQGLLLAMYWLGVIPPVPLSLKHIGIYSSVIPREEGRGLHYTLEYQPAPMWQPWWREATIFTAPEGARAWAFVRVFAPTRFRDELVFLWEYEEPGKGWSPRGDRFVTRLTGGKEAGYRTFAFSTLGRPGQYRVSVLTDDGREIGRKTFRYVLGTPATTATLED